MDSDIISKLKESGLTGRGGAAFPTCLKWSLVQEAQSDKKYIICNGSEGEPSVFKDGYILENHPDQVVRGVKLALKTIDHSEAIIYLRHDYFQKFSERLKGLIGSALIRLFEKKGGYLAGEESVVCQAIEGGRLEPRIKPPYVSTSGIFGRPTLINNVETFYYVSLVDSGQYQGKRFYSVGGDVKKPGVYELPEDWTILQILLETGNMPKIDYSATEHNFFVQVGGAACGNILLPEELETQATGQGAIIVYERDKHDLWQLMQKWANFFHSENCDKCVPCREGIYRIKQMVDSKNIDKELLSDLHLAMQESSFCGLGKVASCPFEDLSDKLL